MGNWEGRFEKNAVTIEKEEKECQLFENKDARLKDQEHFEMAYEWLRSRGKIALLEGLAESV